MNPIDKAEAYKAIRARSGSVRDVAQATGVTEPTLRRYRALLNWHRRSETQLQPPKVQAAYERCTSWLRPSRPRIKRKLSGNCGHSASCTKRPAAERGASHSPRIARRSILVSKIAPQVSNEAALGVATGTIAAPHGFSPWTPPSSTSRTASTSRPVPSATSAPCSCWTKGGLGLSSGHRQPPRRRWAASQIEAT